MPELKYSCVIVDDELNARRTLNKFIEKYCPSVQLVGEASSVREAEKTIKELAPDFVFLDVQLIDGNGFELINAIREVNSKVIITTAYENYAVEAFRQDVIDYLLKPIDPDELKSAVEKVKSRLKLKEPDSVVKGQKEESKSILLSTSEGLIPVQQDQIVCCEACRNYTTFHLLDNQQIVVSKSLGNYEKKLSQDAFFRVHQSFLINWKHVKKYLKRDGGMVLLTNDQEVPVSSRRKESFLKVLTAHSER